MPTVKVNDIDVYYEIYGKGEPLIILQWAGVEITSISRFITEFAKNYKVIALDNRGVGRTDMPDMPYSIEMMADDTIGLMGEIGIKSAHFIGISMGSRIAQVIAVKYPEKVKSLILNVAAASYPDPLKSITYVSLETPELRNKMLQESGIMFIQKYPPNPESFLQQVKAVSDFNGRKQLNQIKAPTLIVNGKKDRFVPMELAVELASGIKGSKLILVGGNHYFAAIEPELLIEPALEFLEEIRAKSALKA
jgi:pimeloyl-ACP methyl ester carboxylesterase